MMNMKLLAVCLSSKFQITLMSFSMTNNVLIFINFSGVLVIKILGKFFMNSADLLSFFLVTFSLGF